MANQTKYSPEVRERAARMVHECREHYSSLMESPAFHRSHKSRLCVSESPGRPNLAMNFSSLHSFIKGDAATG